MNDLQVTQFMHNYCATFRPGNAGEMGKFFSYPAKMLATCEILDFSCAEELIGFLSTSLIRLEEQGFSYSKVNNMHIHSLSEGVAIVSASFKRIKADESLLEEIAATYTLFKGSDSDIKIASVIVHDVANVIVKK